MLGNKRAGQAPATGKASSKAHLGWTLLSRLVPVIVRSVSEWQEGSTNAPARRGTAFPDSATKLNYVNSMFGKIAKRYDMMNRIMSLGQDQKWRRLCVRLAQPRPEEIALDVATGTGDFAIELVRQGAGRVIGIDITEEMLKVGLAKVEAQGLSGKIDLRLGDALDLEFKDNYFGCATTGFAMRNVTDIPRAFAEMHRVVRPGGRVVCLELTHPKLPVWRDLYHFYFYRIVPLLGGILAGQLDAYKYLPNSLTNFPDAETLAGMMRAAGFSKVTYRTLMLGTVAIHVGVK